ncbi:MAG: glycoside hydrolase family 3 N-terminal domain-containing protein, partial [Mycobacteriales bacterium]
SVATVTDPNLAPFGTGIRAGARVVMLSSARYPTLDATQPAVFSRPIVADLLQVRLGFRGVVMTDDIGAVIALRAVPLAQRAIKFINAGGHLVLSVRTADAAPLSNALMAQVAKDPLFRHRIDVAAMRVVQSKIDAGLASCG